MLSRHCIFDILYFRKLCLLCTVFILSLLGASGDAKPMESSQSQDIYLTGNRVCKQCQWEFVGYDVSRFALFKLTNPQGHSGVYPEHEILGVDQNPILRRLVRHSFHGVGLPGKVINPQAFDLKKDDPQLPYYLKPNQ